jgi:hypothetical protein
MGFIAPMVKGMQELRAENLALKAANDNQAKLIDTLTRRLDALESKIVW